MNTQYAIALDKDGNKIRIDDAKNGQEYYCPICGKRMIAKCQGTIREHHFAHKEKCLETWTYDMSEWHREWQSLFPGKTEVILNHNDKTHIADVIVNDYVIEFQHSPIKLEEFRDRNQFYSSLGYKIIWVFDLTDVYAENRIYQKNGGVEYSWSYVRVPFKNMNLDEENVEIFVQLERIENADSKALHHVFTERDSFKLFYSDPFQTLSPNDFLEYVNTGNSSYFKKILQDRITATSDKLNPFAVFDGKVEPTRFKEKDTIKNLWNIYIRSMIVENLRTGKAFGVYKGDYKRGMLYQKDNNGYLHSSGQFFDIENYNDSEWIIRATISKSDWEVVKSLSEIAYLHWKRYYKQRIGWQKARFSGKTTPENQSTLESIMKDTYDKDFVAKTVESDMYFYFRSCWQETMDEKTTLKYYNAYIYMPELNAFLSDYPVNYYIRKHLNTNTWQKITFESEKEQLIHEQLEKEPVYKYFEVNAPINFNGSFSLDEIIKNNTDDFIAKNLENNMVYLFKRVGEGNWNTVLFDVDKKIYNEKSCENRKVWGLYGASKWSLITPLQKEKQKQVTKSESVTNNNENKAYKFIRDILEEEDSDILYLECSLNSFIYVFNVSAFRKANGDISLIEVFEKDSVKLVDRSIAYEDDMLEQQIWIHQTISF